MLSTSEILTLALLEKRKGLKFHRGVDDFTIETIVSTTIYERNALLLLTINSPIELCNRLKSGYTVIENALNSPDYKEYSIAKKKGGVREIFAPNRELKGIQKRLNYLLQAFYLVVKPSEVHGFVINPIYLGKACNIVENAKIHVKRKAVLNIDLKDFFPNIRASRVLDLFSSQLFGFNREIATALTLLTTSKGRLPIGGPTSPVISNFICLEMDRDLKVFCEENKLYYSRYADDLTFSADYPITNDEILDLIGIINKHNFRINEKKLRMKASNRKQTVTGLTVNDKVNVDRKMLKNTRAMLHDLCVNGIEEATKRHFHLKHSVDDEDTTKFLYRLDGYINFIGQVRGKKDAVYLGMKRQLGLGIRAVERAKEEF